MDADGVAGLFDAGFLDGAPHPLRIGRPEEHPFLKRQTRLAFARCVRYVLDAVARAWRVSRVLTPLSLAGGRGGGHPKALPG